MAQVREATQEFCDAWVLAEVQGMTKEDFRLFWDHEAKLKFLREEDQLLKQRARLSQSSNQVDISGLSKTVMESVEAHLQTFSKDQNQALTELRKELQQQNHMSQDSISRGSNSSNNALLESVRGQLHTFSSEQQKAIQGLREELQQQNQAHIADISRLLEGFASLVGRVVKGELETALSDLTTSWAGTDTKQGAASIGSGTGSGLQQKKQTGSNGMLSDQGSGITWSKVHKELAGSAHLSSSKGRDQVSESASSSKQSSPKVSAGVAKKENAKKPVADQNQQKQEKVQQQKQQQKQQQQKQQQKVKKAAENAKKSQAPPIRKIPGESDDEDKQGSVESSLEGSATGSSNLSTYAGVHEKENTSASVHFFPLDLSVNFLINEFSNFAKSGKVEKSPIYYLQDCPCKVRLSVKFDQQNKLQAWVTAWGLSAEDTKTARVFTVVGNIKNRNSGAFSLLFSGISPALKVHKSQSGKDFRMGICLKTAKANLTAVTVNDLVNRNYVLTDSDSVSISWNIKSEVAP